MAVVANPPIWQQNRQYSARLDRTVVDLIFSEGVVDPVAGDFEIIETSPQSLSVAVGMGRAVIQGDDETRQGKYLVVNDATLNVPITAAPSAPNDRIDLIVLRVNDPVAGSARTPANVAEVVAIAGTPGVTPVAPALPDTAIPLAEVYVAAGSTFIANADITDLRVSIGQDFISKSIIDAKGDLIVGTADNTPARLAVGTDGHILFADSGATGGVSWAAPPSGKFVDYEYGIDAVDTISSTAFNSASVSYAATDASNLLLIEACFVGIASHPTTGSAVIERALFAKIRNTTDSVDVTPSVAFGLNLVATSSVAGTVQPSVVIRRVITAGSVASKTYELQISPLTNVNCGVLGSSGAPAIISVTELLP